MFTIFKYFFGLIFIIIFVYVLIVLLRVVIGIGFATVQDTSGSKTSQAVTAGTNNLGQFVSSFSLTNWFRNFKVTTIVSPGGVIPGDTANGELYIDKLYREAQNGQSFDQKYEGNSFFGGNEEGLYDNYNQPVSTFKSEFIKPYIAENSSIKNYQAITGIADYRVFSNKKFYVYVLDANKKIIGKEFAYMNGSMNGNKFYPFRAVISYEKPETSTGYLFFKNMEGVNVQEAGTMMPIYFKEKVQVGTSNLPQIIYPSKYFNQGIKSNESCVVTGCSMQFCIGESQANNLVSTCEWREAYACYRTAACTRDPATGSCGWRLDQNLKLCLQNAQ